MLLIASDFSEKQQHRLGFGCFCADMARWARAHLLVRLLDQASQQSFRHCTTRPTSGRMGSLRFQQPFEALDSARLLTLLDKVSTGYQTGC